MEQRQLALGRIVQSDPAVASVAMLVGATGNQTQNNGRMYITLKPIRSPHHFGAPGDCQVKAETR